MLIDAHILVFIMSFAISPIFNKVYKYVLISSNMNVITGAGRTLKYILDTEPGSIPYFLDSRFKMPKINPGQMVADLHAHPYINSQGAMIDTIDAMANHSVDILAITTHGSGNIREHDYWTVKEMCGNMGKISTEMTFQDHGTYFTMDRNRKKFYFIGAYEKSVSVEGIEGKIDVVSIMPDKGLEKNLDSDINFDKYKKINDSFKALLIDVHPYTISDSYGPSEFFKSIFKFRSATPQEREILQKRVFRNVDCIDTVSSNTAWMTQSNNDASNDYQKIFGKHPLANSDAHSNTQFTRREIGRSGNIFYFENFENDVTFREMLKLHIRNGLFDTYFNYTPSLQFVIGIALGDLI